MHRLDGHAVGLVFAAADMTIAELLHDFIDVILQVITKRCGARHVEHDHLDARVHLAHEDMQHVILLVAAVEADGIVVH